MPFEKGKSGNLNGRPKGSLNKYTEFKSDLIDIWKDGKLKEYLTDLTKEGAARIKKNDIKWIIEQMVRLSPKDIDIMSDGEKIEPTTFIVYKGKPKK